jgi:hypothetical protein
MRTAPTKFKEIGTERADHVATVLEGLVDGAIDDLADVPGINAKDRAVSALGDLISRLQDITAVRLTALGLIPMHAEQEVGRIAAFYAGRAISEAPGIARAFMTRGLVAALTEGAASPCDCDACQARRKGKPS